MADLPIFIYAIGAVVTALYVASRQDFEDIVSGGASGLLAGLLWPLVWAAVALGVTARWLSQVVSDWKDR